MCGRTAAGFLSCLTVARIVVLLAVFAVGGAAPVRTIAQEQPAGISLSDAIRLAEARSERLAIARAGVTRAEGEHKRAKSEYFPQVDLQLRYQRALESEFEGLTGDDSHSPEKQTFEPCPTYTADPSLPASERLIALEEALACFSGQDPFSAFSNLPFGRLNTYGLDLSVAQTAYSGGRVQAQIRAARAGRRSAEIGVESERAQLALEVAAAYWDALLADRLLAIAEATLTLAERTYSQMRLAFELGEEAEFEMLRAQVTMDTQRPVVIQRTAERDAAHMRLRRLVGAPLDAPLALTSPLEGTSAVAIPAPVPELTTPPDTVSERRAAVRQAEETVQVQEAQRDIARAQRLPSVSVFTAWTRVAYPSNLVPAFGDFLPNWTVTALVSLPLFTGGRIKGDELVAQAGLEEAQARMNLTRELAAVDSRQALDLLAAADATWEASSGTVEQAERAYGIAEIRFVEGLATQLDVMDARIQLEQAGANRAIAARNVQVAQLRVALLPLLPLALEQGQVAIQGTVTPVITGPSAVPQGVRAPATAPTSSTPIGAGRAPTGTPPGGG